MQRKQKDWNIVIHNFKKKELSFLCFSFQEYLVQPDRALIWELLALESRNKNKNFKNVHIYPNSW